MRYAPYYNNDVESDDYFTSKGMNYHQGPVFSICFLWSPHRNGCGPWVIFWEPEFNFVNIPQGFWNWKILCIEFFRSTKSILRILLGGDFLSSQTKMETLVNSGLDSIWHFFHLMISCATQAWSGATILDALYDLRHKNVTPTTRPRKLSSVEEVSPGHSPRISLSRSGGHIISRSPPLNIKGLSEDL